VEDNVCLRIDCGEEPVVITVDLDDRLIERDFFRCTTATGLKVGFFHPVMHGRPTSLNAKIFKKYNSLS